MESKLTNNEKNFMRNCLRKFPQFFDWDMVQAVDFCLYAWPDERCVAFEKGKGYLHYSYDDARRCDCTNSQS